jgi:hypothetical protein
MVMATLRWGRRVWAGIGLFILTPGCTFAVLGVLDNRLRILILLGGILCVFGILGLVVAWRLPGLPKSGSRAGE